jgi:predicted acylesterase/phospholipase RssA
VFLCLVHPEVLIQPPLGDVGFLEFNRAEKIIATGYDTMQQKIDQLPTDFFTTARSSS